METPKAFPYTDEELDAAGLMGEGVHKDVAHVIKMMRERPGLLNISLFNLQCMNVASHKSAVSLMGSPTPFNIASNLSPFNPSGWEKVVYYNGIPPDPPELIYRSDLLQNPFPIPEGNFKDLPIKIIYGIHNTPLNTVWRTVEPQIRDILKAQKIRYLAVKPVRFITRVQDGNDTLGPTVVWIETSPDTTTSQHAHDASLTILALLEANGVEGAVVEWYQAFLE